MKKKLRWDQETGVCNNSDKITKKTTYFQRIRRDRLTAAEAEDDT